MQEAAPASSSTWEAKSAAPPEKIDNNTVTVVAIICGFAVLLALITLLTGAPAAPYF